MNLDVVDIKKTYQQGSEKIQVLKGVNFNVREGEVVAILGQSGSGKTTLLSLLAGLDLPGSGEIRMDGQIFSQMLEDEKTIFRGKKIGIVFQSYHLVPHLTALENVMLPLDILGEADPAEKAKALLEQVGLGHRSTHFPSQLSGGECQRTALARALVTKPALLLADEPSGHLDSETGQKVMDLFFDVVRKNKTTTILVTHDAALAKRCDRQLVLKAGVMQV
ncbi:MAG: ABC transporter ATP-binding protein [Bdellovibrionaceae bacterium]|nr:ABC transporter ATP-binding protein [Pseudobdellovibrionaceae bacterium]